MRRGLYAIFLVLLFSGRSLGEVNQQVDPLLPPPEVDRSESAKPADDDRAASPSIEVLLGSTSAEDAERQRDPASMVPQGSCTGLADAATEKLCWQARRAYYDYYISGTQHRDRVFRWQHTSSRIIFVVVLLLVAAGMYFAWVQFHREPQTGDQETELEISTGGSR